MSQTTKTSGRKNRSRKVRIAAALVLSCLVLGLGVGLGLTWTGIVKLTPYDSLAVKQKLAPKQSERQIANGAPVFIRIFKASAELELWMQNIKGQWQLFEIYPICYFSGQLGPKLKEGDKQSPEGFYEVSQSQMNPNSTYHLSFNLGFPNKFDRANGRTGSYLMVHGNCVSIGCYAMTDEKIEEIYTLANAALNNTQTSFQVHVFPFRMSKENMAAYADSKWLGFWQNLKQGYDYFEQHKQPPNITIAGRKYQVSDVQSP